MTSDRPVAAWPDAGDAAAGRPGDGVEVALLDADGVIVSVNQAWQDFCVANGGDPARAGVGVSYLGVCDAAAAAGLGGSGGPDGQGDPVSAQVATAIRRAIGGGLPAAVRLRVPCPSPQAERVFEVQVGSRFTDGGLCVGAMVTLTRLPAAGTDGDRKAGLPGTFIGEAGSAGRWAADAAVPLLEASPDGLVVVGAGGRIMYVNRQLEVLSGYSRQELVGRAVEVLVPDTVRDVHHGLHQEYATAPRARLMGHGGPLQLQCRDGALVPVEISLAPTVVDGQPVVLAAVRDIRQRQELEERLRLVAELLDATSDGVAVLDAATGQRVYVNQAVLDLSGYSREDLAGVPLGAASTPAQQARVKTAITSVVEGRVGEASLDIDVLHRDGSIVPVEMRITARPSSAPGQRPEHLIVVARDISERLAAQEQLRASEESFRVAFDRAPIGMGVAVLGQDGSRTLTRANQALGDLLGVPASQLIGRDFTDFTFPEDQDADRAAAVAMAHGRQTGYARRKRYRRRDGTPVWVDLRSTVVTLPDTPGPVALAHLVDVSAEHNEQVQRTQRAAMAEVVAQVSTSVLAGQPASAAYQQMVQGLARAFGAENVHLSFLDPGAEHLQVVAAVGPVSSGLMRGDLPTSPQFAQRLLRQPRTMFPDPPPDLAPPVRDLLGPGAAVRFTTPPGRTGLVALARARGADPFTETEMDQLTGLADQLALAVELGRARADQERLTLLEERHRIARDLHDTVIQDLFAVGMQLNTLTLHDSDPARTGRLDTVLNQLDHALRRLRGSVFELSAPPDHATPTDLIRAITADAARILPNPPTLTLTGPVDDLPDPVVTELVAVLREALSNVARHAHAQHTDITLTFEVDTLTLTVDDDGTGIRPNAVLGHGLANITHRARTLNGHATITPRQPNGTRLHWTARTRPHQLDHPQDSQPPDPDHATEQDRDGIEP